MNTLKTLLATALATSAILTSTGLLAQPAMEMSGMNHQSMNMGTSMGMDMSSGEVKKIDKETQKITLKHGEIKNMDMPGMTMVFKILDPALLDKVKVADKVNFTAEKIDGALVVTAIETAQ